MKSFRFVLAAICVAASAGLAQAGIILTAEGVDTAGKAGYTTYTVKGSSDLGAIRGFTLSFEGSFSHVNPVGMATPFQDLNAFFGATPVAQDTQFLFLSSSLSPPAIGAAESPTLLTASITGLADRNVNNMIPIAQIVIPSDQSFRAFGSFDETGNPNAVPVDVTLGLSLPPATGNPAAGDISGLLQGAFDGGVSPVVLPIMIMDGVVQSFDLVVDQPGLSSFVQVESLPEAGKYNLVLSGPFSTLDPGTVLSGALSFVTDNGNVDYTFAVSVPEPSTVALTGLALVGLVGFARRKSS